MTALVVMWISGFLIGMTAGVVLVRHNHGITGKWLN
jgi:hypothetical protein